MNSLPDRMDCKQERSDSNGAYERRKKKRRGYWAVLSCFGAGFDMSNGDDDDDAANGLRAKKSLAVVPVETSGGGECDKRSPKYEGKIGGKKEMNRRKSFKDKSKGITSALTKPQPDQQITTVYHVSSNLEPQTEPAPLYRMLDPVQTDTQTRISHSGSSEPGSPPALSSRKDHEKSSKENVYGPSMGLCVLTIALALMLLGGLTLCIICMCTWFGVLYMLRPGTVPELDGTSETDNLPEVVDVNSEEYKRMVVLKGFLERNKRKAVMDSKKGDSTV